MPTDVTGTFVMPDEPIATTVKPPLDEKAIRALRREIDAEHDRIEAELAELSAEHDALAETIAETRQKMLDIEAKMDELKAPLHAKRVQLADDMKGA